MPSFSLSFFPSFFLSFLFSFLPHLALPWSNLARIKKTESKVFHVMEGVEMTLVKRMVMALVGLLGWSGNGVGTDGNGMDGRW